MNNSPYLRLFQDIFQGDYKSRPYPVQVFETINRGSASHSCFLPGRDRSRPNTMYMRDTMVSLIVQTVKYQARSTRTIATHAYTGHNLRLRAGKTSGGGLLARQQLSPALHETGAGRDQLADDDVLFQAHQVVGLRFDSGFRQHAGGFLERGRRQEAVGIERGLGDTEQDGLGRCRFAAFSQDAGVGVRVHKAVYQVVGQHLGITRLVHLDATEHLANDDFDVLVVDIHTCVAIDSLHLFYDVHLNGLASLDAQDILWIALARR